MKREAAGRRAEAGWRGTSQPAEGFMARFGNACANATPGAALDTEEFRRCSMRELENSRTVARPFRRFRRTNNYPAVDLSDFDFSDGCCSACRWDRLARGSWALEVQVVQILWHVLRCYVFSVRLYCTLFLTTLSLLSHTVSLSNRI
jgi:hypothetical protein